MKRLRMIFMAGLVVAGLGVLAAGAAQINAPAPDFALVSAEGQVYRLADLRGKFVVLEWINLDCPFVRKHYDSGNMQKLQEQMAADGVIWLSINSSASGKQGHFEGSALTERIAAEKTKATAYLLDTEGDVGRSYGAQTTPHMYLIDPQGVLIYQGAIDSKSGTDPAEIKDAENYLIKAYTEAKAGEAVSQPQTKAYGCSVKY